jgi:hypothetical protein
MLVQHTNRHIDRMTERQTHTHTERQTDRHTERKINLKILHIRFRPGSVRGTVVAGHCEALPIEVKGDHVIVHPVGKFRFQGLQIFTEIRL